MSSPLPYSSTDRCPSQSLSPSLSISTVALQDNSLFVDGENRKCRKIKIKSSGNQKRKQKQKHFAQLWPKIFVNDDALPVSMLDPKSQRVREIECSQNLIPNQMEYSQKSYLMQNQLNRESLLSVNTHLLISMAAKGDEGKSEMKHFSLCFERKVVSESNWTLDEDVMICELHKERGNDWAYIAARLQHRNRVEVKTRFRSITRAAKRHWTNEQDNLLRYLFVNQYNKVWSDDIASYFRNRTKTSVKSHLRELMEGSLVHKVYPNGSPINVLVQRPDLHQTLLNSIKLASTSKSSDEYGKDEGDGSCPTTDDEHHEIKSSKRKRSESAEMRMFLLSNEIKPNGSDFSNAPISQDEVLFMNQIVFDDDEIEMLMATLSD